MSSTEKALIVVAVGAAGYFAYRQIAGRAALGASSSGGGYRDEAPPTSVGKSTWDKISNGVSIADKAADTLDKFKKLFG